MRNKNPSRNAASAAPRTAAGSSGSSGSSPRSIAAAPVTSSGAGSLIAVELGAAWPETASDDTSSRRRVLSQVEGETPAAFAERAASTFDSLFGRGIALASFVLVFFSSVPAALPFLWIDEPWFALRISNAILIALLFGVGYRWARHTSLPPFRFGFSLMVGGLLMVLLAIALGG